MDVKDFAEAFDHVPSSEHDTIRKLIEAYKTTGNKDYAIEIMKIIEYYCDADVVRSLSRKLSR